MAKDIYAKNPNQKAPQGIGPMAPPAKDSNDAAEKARMKNYEIILQLKRAADAALKTSKKPAITDKNAAPSMKAIVPGKPKPSGTIDTPIEEITRMLARPNNGTAELRSEPIPAAPIPMTGKSPGNYSSAPVPQDTITETPSIPEMSPEDKAAASQEMSQAAFDQMAPTPEAKMQLQQEMQKPTEDGMTLGQKMAAIAMAVAPTVVGYALQGKKGAYLGAAATGKAVGDLEDSYYKNEKSEAEKMKAKAALIKAEKDATSANKFDKLTTDEYGNKLFYDESGNMRPAMYNGQQVREANVPITYINQGGQTESKMKFQNPPGTPQVQESPVGVTKSVNDLISQSRDLKLKFSVLPEVEAFMSQNPQGTVSDMTPTMRTRYYKMIDDQRKLIDQKQIADAREEAKIAGEKRKPVKPIKGPAPTLQDKAAISGYQTEVNDWNKGAWKSYKNQQSNAEMFFKKSLGEIKARGVADSALWFNYMKEIQQDASVVREGDINTAMRFMSTKQRISSWLNQYGSDLGSAMNETMRKEIVNYLAEIRSIKERLAMSDINSMTTKGLRLGFEAKKVPVSSTAQDEARNWASSRLKKAQTFGMAAGTPIWSQRIKQMVSQGQIKNGDFVKDTDGDPYLIEFYTGPSGKIGVRTRYWAVK